VLVDFWTYTCINCIRTLPYLKAWDARYRGSGLTIVGVHTPEFPFEHDAGNVASAISQFGIRYPVVQDNNMGTWNAWGNQYWPADYLVDASGQVRYASFGEGDYDKTEAAVRQLLEAAGVQHLPPPTTAHAIVPSAQLATPETYLNTQRAQGFATQPSAGTHDYKPPAPGQLQLNEFALSGRWSVNSEAATPTEPGASIEAGFQAADVYLVMTSSGNLPRQVHVLLDGRPYRTVTVQGQRLYTLASFSADEQHSITVQVPPGVSAYDFTFG
jgi:thiol-disulfide isomerase/thioredoxin